MDADVLEIGTDAGTINGTDGKSVVEGAQKNGTRRLTHNAPYRKPGAGHRIFDNEALGMLNDASRRGKATRLGRFSHRN
jgi:hypothetical protein